ncbi:HlyD family type I secretion periplasmic adaptor subunit [Granulosicoccus sp. 3-233]|uniref:HlyD family type I secretion periplasmic adaptor subunit n=1 Tax=Granulosicoccus sp. 3-233 TaxID=3417969 RepID=UPI003D327321
MSGFDELYTARLDESATGTPVNSLRRHVTILLVVLMLLSFLAWAGLSRIDQHVRATGRVVPAGNARTVQHLEGGIVMEILVAEGDEVSAGDPLFQIANTRVRTTLHEGTLQQLSQMVRRERLLAEVNGQSEVVFPTELIDAQPDFVDAEQELFSLRRQEHLQKLEGLQKRRDQKRLEIDALKSRVSNMADEVGVLARQAQIKSGLFESGIVSEASYLQVKAELVRLRAERKNAQMQIPIVAAEMEEASSEIAAAAQQYASSAKSELNDVEVSISSLTERLAALADEVERSEIVSPIDGRVNQLFVNTVGGVSQPGAPLVEITPAREALVVEGNMSTADRGKVWPELRTMTHISAYDHALYGGLEGRLSYISPDTFTHGDSREYYKIRVALDSDRFDSEHVVRAGMTAEINILTGRISILGALLKPLTRLRSTALREG